jgi:hypothetical protein
MLSVIKVKAYFYSIAYVMRIEYSKIPNIRWHPDFLMRKSEQNMWYFFLTKFSMKFSSQDYIY